MVKEGGVGAVEEVRLGPETLLCAVTVGCTRCATRTGVRDHSVGDVGVPPHAVGVDTWTGLQVN